MRVVNKTFDREEEMSLRLYFLLKLSRDSTVADLPAGSFAGQYKKIRFFFFLFNKRSTNSTLQNAPQGLREFGL